MKETKTTNTILFTSLGKSIIFLASLLSYFTELTCKTFPFVLPSDANWPTKDKFQALKARLPGKAFLRSEKGYNPHTWNTRTNTPKPAIIIVPTNLTEIQIAFQFAVENNIRVSVQSTGQHQDIRNIYDNAVHFDMSNMKFKSIDYIRSQITVETGNTFGDIHEYIRYFSNETLVVMSGYDRGVGPYGWTVGGGHGLMTRMNGLGVDALVSIELLLANGTIVKASEAENADLFRAVRGGAGPSFGLALNMTIQLYPAPGSLSIFKGVFKVNDTNAELFGNFLATGANSVSGYYKPMNLNIPPHTPYIEIEVFCLNKFSDCAKIFAQFIPNCMIINLDSNADCKPITVNYAPDYFLFQTSNQGGNTPNTPSSIAIYGTYFTEANIIAGLKEINNFISSNKNMMCTGNGVLGGQSAKLDVDGQKTAIDPAMRNSIMSISCGAALFEDSTNSSRSARLKTLTDFGEKTLKKYSKSVYWNEPMHDFPANDWKERYWGSIDNYNKMMVVKTKFDPNNYFTCYHCVGFEEEFSGPEPALCPSEAASCTCNNNPLGQCSNTFNISGFNVKFSAFVLFFVFCF